MKLLRLTFFLLILAPLNKAYSCSCERVSTITKKDIAHTPQILIGEIISVEDISDKYTKATFKVIETLKSNNENKSVTIWTNWGGGASCGLNFWQGQKWYIFTYYYDDKIIASLCGRSALLSDHDIPQNPYGKKHYRRAVRDYKKDKKRALREIKYIKRNYSS